MRRSKNDAVTAAIESRGKGEGAKSPVASEQDEFRTFSRFKNRTPVAKDFFDRLNQGKNRP